jgi:hypothetical protein
MKIPIFSYIHVKVEVNLLYKVYMASAVSPQALDDYSERLRPLSEEYWEYGKDCNNGCYISQGSLEHILFYLSNVSFGIVSQFIPEDDRNNNVERLASFRGSVQNARIPLYQVVGKWHGEDTDTYSIDKGYILVKPNHMTKERFSGFLQQSTQAYRQDAFAIKSPGENLRCIDKDGNVIQEVSGDLSINLLSKAYASRLPIEKRFSFIGLEVPNGSIMSFQLFKGLGVEYYLPEDFFARKKIKPAKERNQGE